MATPKSFRDAVREAAAKRAEYEIAWALYSADGSGNPFRVGQEYVGLVKEAVSVAQKYQLTDLYGSMDEPSDRLERMIYGHALEMLAQQVVSN